MYITARRTATEGFIELSRHTPFYTIYEETFISHTDLSALLRQPPPPSAPNFGGRQKRAHCRPPGLPHDPTAPASGLLHSLAPAAALSSTSTAAKRCGRSAGASGVRSLRDVPRSSGWRRRRPPDGPAVDGIACVTWWRRLPLPPVDSRLRTHLPRVLPESLHPPPAAECWRPCASWLPPSH